MRKKYEAEAISFKGFKKTKTHLPLTASSSATWCGFVGGIRGSPLKGWEKLIPPLPPVWPPPNTVVPSSRIRVSAIRVDSLGRLSCRHTDDVTMGRGILSLMDVRPLVARGGHTGMVLEPLGLSSTDTAEGHAADVRRHKFQNNIDLTWIFTQLHTSF